jgi:hypothetical protein
MRSRWFSILLALLVLVALGVSIVWYYSTKNSRAISHHRQEYLRLSELYVHNRDTIIPNEPQRYALVQAMDHEREALVKLGYLEKRDFPLDHEGFFGSAIDHASFADGALWTLQIFPATNGSKRIARVSACAADILKWEQIISEFNAKTNR